MDFEAYLASNVHTIYTHCFSDIRKLIKFFLALTKPDTHTQTHTHTRAHHELTQIEEFMPTMKARSIPIDNYYCIISPVYSISRSIDYFKSIATALTFRIIFSSHLVDLPQTHIHINTSSVYTGGR